MKKILFYALASTMVVCAGCSDDIVNKTSSVRQGDPITFSARTGYESSLSSLRTVYTDEFYEEGGKNYERVDWVPNEDQIRIYCAEASNPYAGAGKFADYLVTSNTATDGTRNAYATLQSTGSNGALQWGDVNTEHNFYAVYPAPGLFEEGSAGSVSIEGSKVTGVMPTNQTPKSISKETVKHAGAATGENMWVCKPDMRYAFLTAHTAVTPSTLTGSGLNLSLHSIATALELELQCPEGRSQGISLTDVRISSTDNDALCGQFVADLTNVTDSNPYPIMSMGDEQYAQNFINVSLMYNENGTQVPLTLKKDEKVQLTFFMLPVTNLDNLQLTVQSTEGSKTLSLAQVSGKDVVLKAHLKHLFTNIQLPSQEIKQNLWVGQQDDDVILSQLSIPGTGNSYSYKYVGSSTDQYQAQTKTLEEQFNMGIRAFEVTSTYSSSDLTFDEYPIIAGNNGTQYGSSTIGSMVSEIKTLLHQYSTEFAMIIVRFQKCNPGGISEQMNAFANAFATYFDTLPQESVALYKPGLTVNDVRGKILFVLCPTSDGEGYLTTTTQNTLQGKNFLVINGLGGLQDKWSKRGYANVKAPYVGIGNTEDESTGSIYDDGTTNEYAMEYLYLLQEGNSSTTAPTFTNPTRGEANYTYQTNQGFSVWAQEWPRVVKTETDYYTKKSGTTSSYWNQSSYYLWMHWPESYTSEKLPDVKATFDKAIADKENTTTVYFNWLCGYYMTNEEPCLGEGFTFNGHKYSTGSWGVTYGNKKSYATQINSDFYQYILSKGNSITGPMGVVMMDYAGDDDPSIYLPQVIVANNFKFALKKKANN